MTKTTQPCSQTFCRLFAQQSPLCGTCWPDIIEPRGVSRRAAPMQAPLPDTWTIRPIPPSLPSHNNHSWENMLSKSLLLLASLASSVLAAPASCAAPKPATPTLPLTGGAKELTNPPDGLKLLHIALGFGIQNYTCAAAGATPTATGALAVLYDARPLYPKQGPRSLASAAQFAQLPADVLATHPVPLNLDNRLDRADPAHPGASLTEPFLAPPAGLVVDGVNEPLAYIGHHFFTDKGVPAFYLDNGSIFLTSKKDEAVDAPVEASAGPDGTGAVAWLKLSATDAAVGPAKFVYRVLTAGGNSHGCVNGAGGDSTSYTATYWFYG
ncbi:malate dehydrogenase [Cordyceps militaris]|uniref:Malate dehydrogenase n=1 Tax=Cordyceps militaris TaxID=73501 RepID=A0A2H4SQX0_CORMI|nr:malate dehydrogenase [Cordyceps militaris]